MKRILLITYNFPPICGAGSLRWVSLLTYLVDRNMKFDVWWETMPLK